ncbi:MAG: AAA family ATPase [Phycisphaerales bacterium JB039]
MRKVRDALGPDAVILSTHEDPHSGEIKITAALEAQDDSPDILAEPDNSLQAIDSLSEALSYHRVPGRLADRLMAAATAVTTEDAAMALAVALDAALGFAPLGERHARQPLLLAGPPGAGKTATAAKLCAWAKLTGFEASLVTMDMMKAGATSQAKSYAKALHARLEQASDAEDLAHVVDELPRDGFVVIDTVGANPFDQDERSRLTEAARATGACIALVLPAGGDTAESADLAQAFGEAGASILLATKLDAARRLGGILSAAEAGRLALSAAGASPSIGEALIPLNPVSFARLLLPHATQAAAELATGSES